MGSSQRGRPRGPEAKDGGAVAQHGDRAAGRMGTAGGCTRAAGRLRKMKPGQGEQGGRGGGHAGWLPFHYSRYLSPCTPGKAPPPPPPLETGSRSSAELS